MPVRAIPSCRRTSKASHWITLSKQNIINIMLFYTCYTLAFHSLFFLKTFTISVQEIQEFLCFCFSAASKFSDIESKLDRLHLNLDLSDQKQGDTDKQNPVRTVNNSTWQDLKKAEQCYDATHTSQQRRVCIIPVLSLLWFSKLCIAVC